MLSLLISHKLSYMYEHSWNFVESLKASVHIFGLVKT